MPVGSGSGGGGGSNCVLATGGKAAAFAAGLSGAVMPRRESEARRADPGPGKDRKAEEAE